MSDQPTESNTGGNNPGSNRPQYFCHSCHRAIEPLRAPELTCPYCNDGFVEEIGENNDPRDFVEHGMSHETDEEYDDNMTFTATGNQPNGSEVVQLIQNMLQSFLQAGGHNNVRVLQTETNDQEGQQRPNFILAMGGGSTDIGDGRAPLQGFAQIFARALDGQNNAANIFNLFNLNGDPRDYAWGSTGFDNIISQLMEQQAGRQAPPPATEDIINNLPKTKITKKQVAEEQLGCPVCKDEFIVDEEVLILPCTHSFHKDCIAQWLKVSGTCPVCRYSLVNQENNYQNDQNRNNGSGSSSNNQNNGPSTSTFRFTSSSSLPGAYPGSQSNNGQQNRQQDRDNHDLMDLDSEPLD
ncbi:3096_t:CDS:2 [Cetraspora pellucida]|uniref:3096_t:CDS:1 n=1 Tax=Cetraspora pellucida TaxID=1433469 RepID=A0ACA9K237_9GLOM|nr:3096_t:CDS:2 [Cetraspora pellucida]